MALFKNKDDGALEEYFIKNVFIFEDKVLIDD